MKILLTGKDGQAGFALHKRLASLGEVRWTQKLIDRVLNVTGNTRLKTFSGNAVANWLCSE